MQKLKLGYPFSYGDELTPKMARENLNKILTIVLLIWALKVNLVQAAPLPGADGFISTYRCPKRQTYSREATGLSARLEQNPNNQNRPERTNISQYIPEFDSIIDNRQIQKKYKHAPDFGISGNYNYENAQLFKDKIIEHMRSAERINRTYHGKEVIHYFNKDNGLNVMINSETKKFISGSSTSREQPNYILNGGKL